MKPGDVIEKIEFKQSKDFIVDVIRDAVAEKIAMQVDDGDHFELGTKRVFINPPMLVVIDVFDGYLEIGKKGMGDQLVSVASNILKQAIKKDESNGGSASKPQGTAPSASTSEISVEEKIKLVQLLKSIKDLLDVGAITEEEYNSQKEQILSQLTESSNKAKEEPQAPVEEEPQPKPEPVQEEVIEEAPVEEEPVSNDKPVEEVPIEEPVEEAPQEETEPEASAEEELKEEIVENEPVEEEAPIEEPAPVEEVIDKEYCDELARQAKIVFNKERKFKKAYEMLLEASKGSDLGKYYLANFCYLRGWGTKKNVPEAKRILEELAANGYEKAIKALEEL